MMRGAARGNCNDMINQHNTKVWMDVLREKADAEFKAKAVNKWANDSRISDAEFRTMVKYLFSEK